MSTTDFAPGVYPDLTAEDYHADPVPGGSLSSSGARKLLATSPAHFHHEQIHGRPPKATFDYGHAAHKVVLGVGPDIVTVDADDWRTKAARAARDDAHAEGNVPLLAHDVEQIEAMADALRAHPLASALLAPERGRPEQSLFWRDPETDVTCRARFDWLPHPGPGRTIFTDYKTTVSAEPSAIAKAIHSYGYHQQGEWYLDGAQSLGLAEDPAFVLIFQEKTAPYVVTVVELSADALAWGQVLNRKARHLYRDCVAIDTWPGYADDQVLLADLPTYAVRQYEDALDRGVYDTQPITPERTAA